MGIWGVHSFENDDARDWCQAYREMGLPVARSTLEVALGDLQSASLNADIACRAVAAVEAVAFALGRGSAESKDAFQGAPAAEPGAAEALIELCNNAIVSITNGSGLSAHWEGAEPGDHDAWIASMDALQARVNGGAASAVEEPRDAPEPQAPPRAPEPQAVRTDESLQAQLADIRNAMSSLESDIEVLRQEMREGLIELARHISRGSA